MTPTPPAQWLACMVRRWHANPALAHTNDPLNGHGGRMAVLALVCWPDASRELIIACITHDLGESVTGDIPFGAPNKDNAAEQLALEALGFGKWLDPVRKARLLWLDRLDAYYWATHHAPWLVVTAPEWVQAWRWIQTNEPKGE